MVVIGISDVRTLDGYSEDDCSGIVDDVVRALDDPNLTIIGCYFPFSKERLGCFIYKDVSLVLVHTDMGVPMGTKAP